MRINHNIPALRALHQLDKSNGNLDKSLERLSSGLRINHAADDAAGLAITQKMDTQVRGLGQANRNAMDGISLIQTAEGALNEVHAMLQRVRELSVQVSNGTYDASDRKAVQDEVTQLQNEIERIAGSIEFNEMKLLNGDIDRRAFSTNAEIADIVSMSDTVEAGEFEFTVAQLAATTSDKGGIVNLFDGSNEATVAGTLNINGEQIRIEVGQSSEDVFSSIRDLCSRVDISVGIEPTPPFANGKVLTLEMNQFGPKELNVTGDLALLQALGLDDQHFRPNTANVYTASMNMTSAAFAAQIPGSVLINGKTVNFLAGDNTNANAYERIRDANIDGLELTFTGLNLTIYSKKPLNIEPATPADTLLATSLAALEIVTPFTGVAPNDLVKSIPGSGISAVALTGSVLLSIDGAIDPTVCNLAGFNLSTLAGRQSALTTLNAADAPNTTFSFTQDTPPKLISYNTLGKEVTIVPLSNATGVDVDTANYLGYANSDVKIEKGFGNLGRNVQIDASSLVYSADGFPPGTTVTTSGRDIVFQSNNNFELRLVSGTLEGNVTLNLLETGPLDLQIGANEGQFMEIRIQNLSPRALGITDINLSTAEGAQEAIGIIDTAITTISSVRSKLGAYQNRLEHTIANLEAASENMTSSLSRILDADMALEMANYTQRNIIAQAGTSMLAQANQRPQSLLQLLQQ